MWRHKTDKLYDKFHCIKIKHLLFVKKNSLKRVKMMHHRLGVLYLQCVYLYYVRDIYVYKKWKCSSPSCVCLFVDPMDWSPPGSSVHGILQAKIRDMICHSPLQGIFPTQRSNLGRPHSRQVLYCVSYLGSPYMYVWVLVTHLCLTVWPHGLQPAKLLCPWNSPGKSAAEGCHYLLQLYVYMYLNLLWAKRKKQII